ncbi:beta-1,3-glucan-binding protein-like [Amphiura filiformis]|uniref:beta-1,3-glucan-binding protein-like n=1 Tax=Amphiura filiformis TaxID=82378 RepID=UPI003B2115D3
MGHLGLTICLLVVIALVCDATFVDPTRKRTKRHPKLKSVKAKATVITFSGPCTNYPCDASCDMRIAPCNGLIFEDEFDTFDMDTWEHEFTAGGGGNWEFQYYSNNRSNSYVRDGTLFIKPTLTEDSHGGPDFLRSGVLSLWGGSPANLCTGNAWWGCERTGTTDNYINPIQSARLRTVNSLGFTYGKVEVSAKMPVGDWLWPAIWLLPVDNPYGGWPASGEIDIVEARGNLQLTDKGTSVGVDQVGSTMHWGPFFSLNSWDRTHGSTNLQNGHYGEAFHLYTLEWTPTEITISVDSKVVMRADPGPNGFYDFGDFANRAPNTQNPWENSPNKMAPFDREFYIIMNVAVGGTGGFFSDGLVNKPYPKPWKDTSGTAPKDFYLAKDDWYPTWNGEDAALQIKYIRVWAHGSY